MFALAFTQPDRFQNPYDVIVLALNVPLIKNHVMPHFKGYKACAFELILLQDVVCENDTYVKHLHTNEKDRYLLCGLVGRETDRQLRPVLHPPQWSMLGNEFTTF